MFSLVLLAAAATASPDEILVTASLVPTAEDLAPVSSTVFDETALEGLDRPLVTDLLRLSPGVSVATSGAKGSQTQLRLRGSEGNHTLAFIDGIDMNDPAAGNEARWETFTSDGLGRVELIRGPQSALWGSEAIGGVVAMETRDPLGGTAAIATAEYGSRDTRRGSAALTYTGKDAGITATGDYLHSDGNDILGGGRGDKDGFTNRTFAAKGIWRPNGGDGEFGFAARTIDAENQFDGTDPVFFTRADTLDHTHTRTSAGRVWTTVGLGDDARWSGTVDAQGVTSSSRNYLGEDFLNRLHGDRFRVGGQLVHRFAALGATQQLIARVEQEEESFRATDPSSGDLADQKRTRARTASVVEWLGGVGDRLVTDVAVRRDAFNRFRDATTVRAGATFRAAGPVAIHGSYGEGIAQPTFYDLYGFYPGSFVGNAALRPERSRGFELGARWSGAKVTFDVTAYTNRFRDEIAQDYSNYPVVTAVNLEGGSRRRGVEASGEYRPFGGLMLFANYTLTDSRTRDTGGGSTLRAVRRPKNAANVGVVASRGPIDVSASLSYVGARRDTDFDLYPAADVRLGDYLLADGRIGYRLNDSLELFGRIENAFNQHYQDVVGYATPGRSVYGGIRVRFSG